MTEAGTLADRLITSDECIFVVIDVQEGFVEGADPDQTRGLIDRILSLGNHAIWAGIPVIATVETPEEWGGLHPRLESAWPEIPVLRKEVFGLASDDAVFPALAETGRRTAILVGLQTDVCVAQSAVGLRAREYEVVCITDAVASIHAIAHQSGLERMRSAGVVVLCARQLHAEWARTVAESERYHDAHPDAVPGV